MNRHYSKDTEITATNTVAISATSPSRLSFLLLLYIGREETRLGRVEFHLYQNGGHGFGLGNPNRTSNRWFDAFMHWLDVNGFLAKSKLK